MYDHIASVPRDKPGATLRALWATLAGICLLGAGVSHAARVYTEGELERAVTRDARKLSLEVVQPLLVPSDADGPLRGERYDAVRSALDERVLAGPIDRVRVWRPDGVVVFADDPSVVGDRVPEMRDDLNAAAGGASESVVSGDRFRTLTMVRVGDDPVFLAVELGRSHAALVEPAEERWGPWVVRGGVAAAAFAGLSVATALVFWVLGWLKRRAKARPAPAREPARRRPQDEPPDDDAEAPAYMHPGYQEEYQARKRAEEALAGVERQRDDLLGRVRMLEQELEELRAQANGREPARPAQP